MTDEPTSTWPTIRVNPATKTRLAKLKTDAAERSSVIQLVNDLLSEALDQIESSSDELPPLPTVLRLRKALGKYSGTEFNADFAEIVTRLEKQQRVMRAELDSLKLRNHAEDEPSARVAEDAPAPRRTRKR